MKKSIYIVVFMLLLVGTLLGQEFTELKKEIIASIDAKESKLIDLSDQIWAYAEIAFMEEKSAKALADYAEESGFMVRRDVAGMPTGFIAEYGSEGPIIGILGEFDALPGLSQKTVPNKDPLQKGKAGHGCGHNLFGVGSLAAAIAIKEQIESGALKGTIRYYGTPAEEKYFGKLFMAREGMFDDLDVCLDWHPSAKTSANVQSSLALIDFIVEFYGQAAHASGDPWNGRSAVDGLEFFTTGLNYMREHIKPTVRIHYQIQHGGDVVNVVPDYSKIWTRVRDCKKEDMLAVYKRVEKIAEGAAMMANVDYKITLVSGLHEVIPNRTGGAILQANLEKLGAITYTPEEIEFAKAIQRATGKPEIGINSAIKPLEPTLEFPSGGSTDVGDVSWLVPEIRLGVTTAPEDTPWHSWAVVACGGMSIGHKGMSYAAKALALTICDLLENPDSIDAVKKEFDERIGDKVYEAILPPGPPPLEAAAAGQ